MTKPTMSALVLSAFFALAFASVAQDTTAPTPTAQRPVLGVEIVSGEGDGVVVEVVRPGTPAEKAGVKSGDHIVKFGDVAVDSDDALITALTHTKPGATVKLGIERDGKPLTLGVTFPGGDSAALGGTKIGEARTAKTPEHSFTWVTPEDGATGAKPAERTFKLLTPSDGPAVVVKSDDESLRKAVDSLEKALAILDGKGGPAQVAKAREVVSQALDSVRAARKAMTTFGPGQVVHVSPSGPAAPPVPATPPSRHGDVRVHDDDDDDGDTEVDPSKVDAKVRSLIEHGKSAADVEAELRKMFPGAKVKVAVDGSSDHAEAHDSHSSSDSSSSSSHEESSSKSPKPRKAKLKIATPAPPAADPATPVAPDAPPTPAPSAPKPAKAATTIEKVMKPSEKEDG